MFRMKSLRLGNFRSILDMLGPEGNSEDRKAASRGPGSSSRSAPAGASKGGFRRIPDDRPEAAYVPLEKLARLYGESRLPDQPSVAEADDAAVAAELRLSTAKTREDLRQIRRSFAMRNHPDRVPEWLRDEATRRMRIANAMIDGAMRAKGRK
jgi:hypothetical protein